MTFQEINNFGVDICFLICCLLPNFGEFVNIKTLPVWFPRQVHNFKDFPYEPFQGCCNVQYCKDFLTILQTLSVWFHSSCNILWISCFDMCLVIVMATAKFQGYFHLTWDRCCNFPRILLLYFIHWSRHEKSRDNGKEFSRKILKIVEIWWLKSRSFGCKKFR